MFSKLSFLSALVATTLSFKVSARELLSLEPGSYTLIEGDRQLCQNFSLSERDLLGSAISLGSLYAYDTKNSIHAIESDIDPACEFKEVNQRESTGGQTILTRTNEEFCRGKLRSRTISIANLNGNKIVITHHIDRATPYKCTWIKE